MKTRHMLLLATVATGGMLAAFASGAVPLPLPDTHPIDAARTNTPFMVAEDREENDAYRPHRKDDDDRDRHYRDRGHDDDDDDDDDDGRSKVAPASDATPPDNGLILKGTKPKVQVN